MEDDDLVGAGEDDADEAGDEEDDDILDEEDDEVEDEEDDEVEEEGDEQATTSRETLTGEVGSEGGSPGETVLRRRSRAGLGHGSEATTTWQGGDDALEELEDEEGVPVKRAP
jgi:hypothetical protein